jgi:amino acid transporter
MHRHPLSYSGEGVVAMKKALNTWTLSGLMIGPILGSGIVFLPPLAYDALQNYALVAWIIMMALGGLFAYLFAKMTVMTNSNEGMSLMVGRMLGGGFRELSSNCLTAAVFFGPVPVAKTAASFLRAIIPMLSEPVLTVLVLLAIYGLVASGMYAMGRLILLLSTATALLLIGGSIATLMSAPVPALPQGQLDLRAMGNTLLLLFWAIIGWEMLANYIEEVNDPAHTILRAMKISLVSIITIYLLTTFALQTYFQAHPGTARIQPLLYPLMGRYANLVFSLLAGKELGRPSSRLPERAFFIAPCGSNCERRRAVRFAVWRAGCGNHGQHREYIFHRQCVIGSCRRVPVFPAKNA